MIKLISSSLMSAASSGTSLMLHCNYASYNHDRYLQAHPHLFSVRRASRRAPMRHQLSATYVVHDGISCRSATSFAG